jgi:hypothetical protein
MSSSSLSRRQLLQAVGTVGVASIVGQVLDVTAATAATAAAALVAPARADIGVSAYPFDLGQVRLTGGRWLYNQDRTLAYLRFIDADRMLHTFRVNAGLSSTAQPVGGWEGPGVELRGHSMGHLLSALAQA